MADHVNTSPARQARVAAGVLSAFVKDNRTPSMSQTRRRQRPSHVNAVKAAQAAQSRLRRRGHTVTAGQHV